MAAYWVLQKILVKKIIEVLEASPDIVSVRQTNDYLTVKFRKTGISEYWSFGNYVNKTQKVFKIPENALSLEKPKLTKQFETNPLYEDEFEILKDHFSIRQSSIQKAGFVNLRLAIHNIASVLHDQGWLDLKYTNEILENDFHKLINADLSKHQVAKIRFIIYRNVYNGRRILHHYTPIARSAASKWKNVKVIYTAINSIIDGGTKDLTRENLVNHLAQLNPIPPNYYRSLFTELDLSDKSMIDLYPTTGSRGLGAMLAGVEYAQVKGIFEKPLINISNDFGLIKPISSNLNKYDVAVLSRDFPLDKAQVEERISRYNNLADSFLIMIKKEDREELIKKYNPSRVLRISTGIGETANEDNYLLAIDQR